MRSSYRKDDVTLLLKDLTGLIEPLPTAERERLIQGGTHYSEMLPIEYVPTDKYMKVYEDSLRTFSKSVALSVGSLSDLIVEKRGRNVVLVSLARAGIPVGILLKRYMKWKYAQDLPHYSISIIRGRGIDKNAVKHILERHNPKSILFVDGWTGKGAILSELRKALEEFPGVPTDLAVLSDPANETALCGTHEDILIPSSCLNSTVSGLVSRTVLRDDLIGENDFHGAVFYENLLESDLSYGFIESIEREFETENPRIEKAASGSGLVEVRKIAEDFGIGDLNLVKPGIGEATRVLLRRLPWKVLVDPRFSGSEQLRHLFRLAREKNVPVEERPLRHYKCCGLIKKLADN